MLLGRGESKEDARLTRSKRTRLYVAAATRLARSMRTRLYVAAATYNPKPYLDKPEELY